MNLHEAIKKVLLDHKNRLSARQISHYINEDQLYTRLDRKPVSADQIRSRIANHQELFIKDGDLFYLKGFDELGLLEEEIKTDLYDVIGILQRRALIFDSLAILELFLIGLIIREHSLNRGINVREYFVEINQKIDYGRPLDLETETQLKFLRLIQQILNFPNRFQILQKLITWSNKGSTRSSVFIMPDYLCSIISDLNIYSPRTFLHCNTTGLNNFKLSIFERHPEYQFQHVFFGHWWNDAIVRLNSKLLEATDSLTNNIGYNDKYSNVAIITPPWNLRDTTVRWSSNFIFIAEELEKDQSQRLNKAVLVIPEGSLYAGGKDLEARTFLTHSKYVESIISIPFKSNFANIKSIALIMFDFDQVSDRIFFADFNDASDFNIVADWNKVSDIINNKRSISGISEFVNQDTIKHNAYNWSPRKYVYDPQQYTLKEGHQLIQLKFLLLKWSRGKSVDRNALYTKGEIKFIRSRDLPSKGILFEPNRDILGIDYDELNEGSFYFDNSVVVSLLGNHAKASTIPQNTPLVFDRHLAILEANPEVILADFLAYELREDYVTYQLNIIRNGVTIPRVRIADFLEINIQVPTFEVQKDKLLQKNRLALSNSNAFQNDEQTSSAVLHNYLGVIKHTMKQPLATLTEDINSLQKYLKSKSAQGVLNLEEFVVDLLPGEKDTENEQSKVVNTLARMSRSITNAHWRLEQSEQLLKIETTDASLNKENIKSVLSDQMNSYPDINVQIKGKNVEVQLDRNLWSILLDNLIDNALKHGFIGQNDKRVSFVVETEINPDGNKDVVISYRNNGKPLSSDFDIEKFASKGITTNKEAGDGFGGYLINSILKKHNGRMEIVPASEMFRDNYTVCFKFYLKAL